MGGRCFIARKLFVIHTCNDWILHSDSFRYIPAAMSVISRHGHSLWLMKSTEISPASHRNETHLEVPARARCNHQALNFGQLAKHTLDTVCVTSSPCFRCGNTSISSHYDVSPLLGGGIAAGTPHPCLCQAIPMSNCRLPAVITFSGRLVAQTSHAVPFGKCCVTCQPLFLLHFN